MKNMIKRLFQFKINIKESKNLSKQADLYFSKVKMYRYQQQSRKSKIPAVDIYIRNIELSQEILGLISIFEIILKNKIDPILSPLNYLDESSKILTKQDYNTIKNTREKILKDSEKPVDISSRLMSNLTLGFWCGLFKNKQLWAKYLSKIFDQKTRKINKITHSKMVEYTRNIRLLRNRVAHHERIVFKSEEKLSRTINQLIDMTIWLISENDMEFRLYILKELMKKKRAIDKIKGSILNM